MQIELRTLLLSLVTVLFWGVWGFFGKLALEKRMVPFNLFVIEVVSSVVCVVVVGLAVNRKTASLMSMSSYNIFGIFSGIALAVGLLCYYSALQRGQVWLVVPLTATYPVISVALGFTVLGERPSVMQWIGVAMIVGGAVLLLFPFGSQAE